MTQQQANAERGLRLISHAIAHLAAWERERDGHPRNYIAVEILKQAGVSLLPLQTRYRLAE